MESLSLKNTRQLIFLGSNRKVPRKFSPETVRLFGNKNLKRSLKNCILSSFNCLNSMILEITGAYISSTSKNIYLILLFYFRSQKCTEPWKSTGNFFLDNCFVTLTQHCLQLYYPNIWFYSFWLSIQVQVLITKNVHVIYIKLFKYFKIVMLVV